MKHDQNYLNYYFGNVWYRNNGDLQQYGPTGLALVSKIQPQEAVLDVGCGANPFKGLIGDLTGIDPAFDQADFKVTIEDFQTERLFDVALCLGSINFGNVDIIENQIAKVISLLKPQSRIYWRSNPGRRDHRNEECNEIDFYPWSIEEHVRLSDKFGYVLKECMWDKNNRIYAEWHRK